MRKFKENLKIKCRRNVEPIIIFLTENLDMFSEN